MSIAAAAIQPHCISELIAYLPGRSAFFGFFLKKKPRLALQRNQEIAGNPLFRGMCRALFLSAVYRPMQTREGKSDLPLCICVP
jgi:hypothetical protein